MSGMEEKRVFGERRKRLKRPRILFVLASVIVLMPFSNYVGMALFRHLSPFNVIDVFSSLTFREYLFLISSLGAGIGLIMIRKWGWWLFIIAGFVFVLQNIYIFIINSASLQPGPILHTSIIAVALAYFLRKDIFIPYLKIHRHGWRFFPRYKLQIPIIVDGVERETENISAGGCFVIWPEHSYESSQGIRVKFHLDENVYEFDAGVASTVAGVGIGVAFRNMSAEQISSLKSHLKKYRASRLT